VCLNSNAAYLISASASVAADNAAPRSFSRRVSAAGASFELAAVAARSAAVTSSPPQGNIAPLPPLIGHRPAVRWCADAVCQRRFGVPAVRFARCTDGGLAESVY